MGGSKLGGEAHVSCMGHLTSRFGNVKPHGKVSGAPIRSIAVCAFSSIVGAIGYDGFVDEEDGHCLRGDRSYSTRL